MSPESSLAELQKLASKVNAPAGQESIRQRIRARLLSPQGGAAQRPGAAERPSAERPSAERPSAERYEVQRLLGRGGMGAVYQVRDSSTGRELALMRLHEPGSVQRLAFRREFHTLARLEHPRIVEAYEYGLDREGPYCTMELLSGQDLRGIDEFPWVECCRLIRDVATALAFLHSKRLIHRDLTTRNIRRTAEGHAKLFDFGLIATEGFAGELAGTIPYLAPETVRGQRLDYRVDLFSLGVLAYRLLTGRLPFAATAIEELSGLWAGRLPAPSEEGADITEELDQVILSLLNIDRNARPGSAAEVIDRLGVIADLGPLPEVTIARGYLRSPELVGREHALADFHEALDGSISGRGGALLFQGPAGIGKSTLLQRALLDAQVRGTTTVDIDCLAGVGGPGLHRLRDHFKPCAARAGRPIVQARSTERQASLPGEASMNALLARLERKYVMPLAHEAVLQRPYLATGLLTRQVADKSQGLKALKRLLGTLLSKFPEVIEAIRPTLDEGEQNALEAVESRRATAPSAPDDALPPVLVCPPWKTKTKPQNRR